MVVFGSPSRRPHACGGSFTASIVAESKLAEQSLLLDALKALPALGVVEQTNCTRWDRGLPGLLRNLTGSGEFGNCTLSFRLPNFLRHQRGSVSNSVLNAIRHVVGTEQRVAVRILPDVPQLVVPVHDRDDVLGILAPENDLLEVISAMVCLDTVCLEQNTVLTVVLSETFEVTVMGVEGEVVPAEFLCVLFEVSRQRKLLHPIHTKLKSVLGDCFWVVGEVHQPSILDIPTIVHGQERGSHGGVILHCSTAV